MELRSALRLTPRADLVLPVADIYRQGLVSKGGPGWIRTSIPPFAKQALCPIELRGRKTSLLLFSRFRCWQNLLSLQGSARIGHLKPPQYTGRASITTAGQILESSAFQVIERFSLEFGLVNKTLFLEPRQYLMNNGQRIILVHGHPAPDKFIANSGGSQHQSCASFSENRPNGVGDPKFTRNGLIFGQGAECPDATLKFRYFSIQVRKNQLGQHRLLIDPRCRELIRDLEQVGWKTDAHGNPSTELDKSDRRRTHVSDALGYLIAHQFPMRSSIGFRSERLF
jgi:hypothetical protein